MSKVRETDRAQRLLATRRARTEKGGLQRGVPIRAAPDFDPLRTQMFEDPRAVTA